MSESARNQQNIDRGAERGSAAATTQRPAAQGQQTQTEQPMARPARSVSLKSEQGTTRIADTVVAKIAGLAARDIPGVYSMGTGMARRVGQLRSLIPGGGESGPSQGVSVEVGEREAAIDLDIVTWYGQSIVEISDAVRRNVTGQVEGMTGLRVVEINIDVDDIHVEGEGQQQGQQQRVQ